jgi:hypothetical protein
VDSECDFMPNTTASVNFAPHVISADSFAFWRSLSFNYLKLAVLAQHVAKSRQATYYI